ncbi:MAG: hypothetical protein U9R74_00810 [Pseudomonadota bacterium]|nr:hypothetical protein [Pseudomonadota bacterium]
MPILFALTGMSSLSAPQPAFAEEDGKLYPGTFCTGQYGPISYKSYIRYRADGSISNTSPTKSIAVQCLVINDVLGNLKQVSVYYSDNHTSNKVSCYTRTHLSNSSRTIVSQTSGASPSGRHTGVFTIKNIEPSSKSYKYFMLRCSVPPKTSLGESGINAIKVTERD